MNNESKTSFQSSEELSQLRSRIAELERNLSEALTEKNTIKDYEREAIYRTLVETTPDIIFVTDRKGFFTYINPCMEKFLGYSQQDLTGKPFTYILPPELASTFIDRFRKSIKGEKSPPYITNMVTKDGTPVFIEFNVTSLFDTNGKFAGRLGIGRDMTERIHMQRDLTESEIKYRTLFESANDAIFLMDQQLFIDCNQKTLDMFGCTREQIINHPPYRYSPEKQPDGRPSKEKAQEKIQAALDGHAQFFGWEHCRYDGTPFHTEISLNAVKLEKNNYILAIVRDITGRKAAEEALRRSEERYRQLVDNINLGIFIAQDGMIRFVNPMGIKITGCREQDILARPFIELIHPDDRELVWGRHARRMRGEDDQSRYEFRIITGDGSTKWVELSSVKIQWDGKVASLSFLNDITERKHVEEEKRNLEECLQRAEKMEALGTLAGGVAHDLNNVLGIVVGYAELLLDEINESSPLRGDITKIIEGGQRSAAIVQDLLTLARRGIQIKNVFNFNTAIMDFQKSSEFEKLSSVHPTVRIEINLEADLLNIKGSPVHLTKTFINLVANAMEAMPGGGVLTITTSNRSLDKPVQGYDTVNVGDYVVLGISDTGEGISDRDMKHIFEPFYTKKFMGRSGTGLGLAVVWGTVKDHNGYINIQSEVGKGTTFTLYFPVSREEIAGMPTAVPSAEFTGNGESILVIDDIKEQRELAAKILGKRNYTVKTVSSGEEAVKYLRTEKADLLVLDMIMDPGMDGIDTYKAILEIHPGQKAIIVSGFTETERVKEARILGAGDYLRKPYVQTKLGLAVRKELDRK
ncbi:MAG: Sensor histidine kinase RcsC [Syntrophus sp. SKADARSKE-3]|nr:Sensor histidine kinase RcsC [Syntrophus sp. SKADARSKE-3]